MKKISKTICFYKFIFLITLLLLVPATKDLQAQTFTPIYSNYECGQFPDGKQYLTRKTNTGYELVRPSDVKAILNKERKILKQRLRTINELLSGFKKSRISVGKLLSGANKILNIIFGGDPIPKELPPGQAEVAVFNLRQRILDRDAILATINNLINDCESGINPKKGKGNPIGVSVQAISLASSNTIYGGFMISSAKIKSQFSKKPTGYNVCLKMIFPDGSVGKFYTGFGDDFLCGTGTSKFEGVLQSECNKLLPKGQAGYVIQKRTYAFTSLPDATTEQLLERMRVEVLQDQPIVGVMAFPATLSRNASVKACEAF